MTKYGVLSNNNAVMIPTLAEDGAANDAVLAVQIGNTGAFAVRNDWH